MAVGPLMWTAKLETSVVSRAARLPLWKGGVHRGELGRRENSEASTVDLADFRVQGRQQHHRGQDVDEADFESDGCGGSSQDGRSTSAS